MNNQIWQNELIKSDMLGRLGGVIKLHKTIMQDKPIRSRKLLEAIRLKKLIIQDMPSEGSGSISLI